MSTRNFSLILAFILVLTVGMISAADYHGVMKVNTGTGNIVIPSCREDWTGSTWSSCVNGYQTFICFDKNNCRTNYIKPALCGTTRDCSVPNCGDAICNNGETCSTCAGDCGACPVTSSGGGSSGGGGGGGGSSSGGSSGNVGTTSSSSGGGICIESWQCTEWSNSNDACGTRSCTDSSKCGTTQLKPEISKKCPSTGLFGLTGGAIGAIGDFALSPAGIVTFSGSIAFIVLMMVIFSVRRKKSGK